MTDDHKEQHTGLRKSPSLVLALVLIPVFFIGFILILSVQQQRTTALKADVQNLTLRLRSAETERAFYKGAYMTALDDLSTVSKAYGGDDRYRALADEMREKELATLINITNVPLPIALQDRVTWAAYVQRGAVSRACLQKPAVIDTITDDTLLSITASGANATLAAYVDGTLVGTWALGPSATYRTSVTMPPDTYEFTLVSNSGSVHIERVMFDTAEYPLASVTRDLGQIWRAFDCVNASQGAPSLEGPGAIRFLVEKR